MGLRIHVYRWALQDCTNGGISSRAIELTLMNVSGPSNSSPDAPAAVLVENTRGTLRIVPAQQISLGVWVPVRNWCMMGGNYGATSDSRFSEAARRILGNEFYGAVPIHDRIET